MRLHGLVVPCLALAMLILTTLPAHRSALQDGRHHPTCRRHKTSAFRGTRATGHSTRARCGD